MQDQLQLTIAKKIVAHIIKSKDNIFNANIVKIRVNPKIIKMCNVVKES